MEVNKIITHQASTIKEALIKIDNSGLGILFIINEKKSLIGIITDGDIRRAIVNNNDLSLPISKIMNVQYVSLPIHSENHEILNHLNDSVKIIPLLDENNVPVDYASLNRLRKISVSSPFLSGNELEYVTDCIKTNWISSQGKYVKKFEEMFSTFHNNYYSLAVSNGTVALHLAMLSLGIKEGDEVIVPDLTFAATINAILYVNATPVIVDICNDTWNIDPKKLKNHLSDKTKAILVVHLYGIPAQMDEIMTFAKENNLYVIEDCAEALGSKFNNQPVGTFGDVSTFSFYGNKMITTGEGGMILFKNQEIYNLSATLRDHGMDKNRRYWHEMVGFNYRLTNIQAAIGVAQFEQIEYFVNCKRKIASNYRNYLNDLEVLTLPVENVDCYNSFWLYTLLVNEKANFNRDELISYLTGKGIETRPIFFSLHQMPPYVNFGEDKNLRNSIVISNQGISLPSSVNLSENEIKYICNEIIMFINNKTK